MGSVEKPFVNMNLINNLSFSKSKNKWEVIGKLTELYLKTEPELNLESLNNQFKKQGAEVTGLSEDIKVQNKYRSEILELIRMLSNSPP